MFRAFAPLVWGVALVSCAERVANENLVTCDSQSRRSDGIREPRGVVVKIEPARPTVPNLSERTRWQTPSLSDKDD